jgi:uncharacterized protein (TIGR03000 family)
MMHSRILPLALFALLVPAGAAPAQVAGGSPALNGWTSGSPLARRSIVHASAYSASPYYPGTYASLAEPIFMTTLQTPGIYGAYSFGTGGITRTREPWFSPVVDDRETIPALSITTAPIRTLRTPMGAPTMAIGTPPPAPSLPPPPATDYSSPELTARVVVRVPEDARLEFEGVVMPETGRIRHFVSPALVPGRSYRYAVRATWQEDGREVVQERYVRVYAGDKAEVDFLSPDEDNRERRLRIKPVLPAPSSAGSPLRPASP